MKIEPRGVPANVSGVAGGHPDDVYPDKTPPSVHKSLFIVISNLRQDDEVRDNVLANEN